MLNADVTHTNRMHLLNKGSRHHIALCMAPKHQSPINHGDLVKLPWEAVANIATEKVAEQAAVRENGPLTESGPRAASDGKPKRWSSGRLHNFLVPAADQPRLSPKLEAQNIDISKALLGNPDNFLICWSSLGALLLYLMGGDDKAGSKDRSTWFLDQAKDTFGQVITSLEELYVGQSTAFSVDAFHIGALQEQMKSWPRAEVLNLNKPILGTEVAGFGVTANMESEVHVHIPRRESDTAFHGTILTLDTSGHRLKRPAMGPVEIAALILVLHCCHRDINLSQEFIRFLFCYLAGEEPSPRAVIWHSHDPLISGTLRMEFHLRCFGRGRILKQHQPKYKILCRRFQSFDVGINISERRRSIALLSPFHEEDKTTEITGDYVILRIQDDRWEEAESAVPHDLHLCQPWTSVAMFQQVLYKDLGWWAQNWHEVLHTIDALVSFEISDVLDTKSRVKLMYDDDKLNTSETYFTVLQLLRVFKNWTSEPEDNIRKLIQQFHFEMDKVDTQAQEAQHIIESNWTKILSHVRSLTKDISDRIEWKISEVESLRDGLYNTMQVKEARRSTKMSQIMLVFTIATIIYLPLTFVAALFALDIFPVTAAQFWQILTGTSVVTYVLATTGLFAIYQKGPFHWLRNQVQRIYEGPEGAPRLSKIPLPDTKYQDRFKEGMASTNQENDTADPMILGPAGLLPSGWVSHYGPKGWYFVNTDTGEKVSSRPKLHLSTSDTADHASHFFGRNSGNAQKRPKYWRAGDGSSRPRLHEAQKVFSS